MIKQITLDEARNLIKENEKVLLLFSTPWCGECKMNKLIWEKVFPEYEDHIKIAKIDVDEQKAWAEDAKDFNVDGVPTLIGYKNGEKVFVHDSFTTEPNLRKLLDTL